MVDIQHSATIMGGREVSRPYQVWFFAEGDLFLFFWRCHRPRWGGRRRWCGVADSSLSLNSQTTGTVLLVCICQRHTKRTVPLVCDLCGLLEIRHFDHQQPKKKRRNRPNQFLISRWKRLIMVNSMQANEAVQWKNTGGLKQKHKKQPFSDASASHLSLVLRYV